MTNDPFTFTVPTYATEGLTSAVNAVKAAVATKKFSDSNGHASAAAHLLHELVSKDAVFAATGVTKGAMLDGVTVKEGFVSTHTVVMDSASRTVRRIRMTRPV